MPIFLYWVLEPIIISLINQDRAPHQQQCIYSNIDIKNAVKLSLYWCQDGQKIPTKGLIELFYSKTTTANLEVKMPLI